MAICVFLPVLNITHKILYISMFDTTCPTVLIDDKEPLCFSIEVIPGIMAKWETSKIAKDALYKMANTA